MRALHPIEVCCPCKHFHWSLYIYPHLRRREKCSYVMHRMAKIVINPISQGGVGGEGGGEGGGREKGSSLVLTVVA